MSGELNCPVVKIPVEGGRAQLMSTQRLVEVLDIWMNVLLNENWRYRKIKNVGKNGKLRLVRYDMNKEIDSLGMIVRWKSGTGGSCLLFTVFRVDLDGRFFATF